MVTLAIAAASLVGCAGQQTAGDAASVDQTSQAASVDSSAWKTLGDALVAQTSSMESGWDDNYYVNVFEAGASYYRVVAKMDAEASKRMDEVDWIADDVDWQIQDAVGGLPLVSVEDITDERLSQEELDGLVGKTGQELVDAGFVFQDYYMYGGEETGANFAKGPFCYMLTFGTSIAEKDTSDEGASVMGAKVTEAELSGAADGAADPTKV